MSLFSKFDGNVFKAATHIIDTTEYSKTRAYRYSFARFAKRYREQAHNVSGLRKTLLIRKANFYQMVSDYLKKEGN